MSDRRPDTERQAAPRPSTTGRQRPSSGSADPHLDLIEDLTPSLLVTNANWLQRDGPWLIAHASALALELFGVFEQDDLVGAPLAQFVSGADASAMRALLVAASFGRQPRPINIFAWTLPGDRLPVRVGARMIEPGSVRLVFLELERFDEAAARLRASEARYRQLFHAVPIALLRIDARGSMAMFEEPRRLGVTDLDAYLRANPAAFDRALDTVCVAEANEHAELLLGNGEPRSMLRPVRVYWEARPDTFRRILTARYNGHRSVIEETVVCGLAGQRVPVLFSMAFPTDAARQGNSLIGMIDMTAQVRAEAELRQTQARFADATRLAVTNELAASIAHEVSQPLSSIATNGGTALRWLSQTPPDLERAVGRLQRVMDDAQRANGVIGRMRDMSAGVMSEQSPMNVNAVVRESLLILQDELRAKMVSVRLHVDEALPALCGDQLQLTQVMVNLLINAMQAMEKSGTATPAIDVRTRLLAEGYIAVEVQDSGPGIGADHLSRIFDSFFTTKKTGLGIGLAICRSIVEAHRGSLLVENAREGGAIFTIMLPLAGFPHELPAFPDGIGKLYLSRTLPAGG